MKLFGLYRLWLLFFPVFLGVFMGINLHRLESQPIPTSETRRNCKELDSFFDANGIVSTGVYKVIKGKGEITKSSHPKLLPAGFGKDWNVENGFYDPVKKHIMLVIKKRLILLYLEAPLADNKTVRFAASTCGKIFSEASTIGFLIRPGLTFITNDANKGSLVKRGQHIEGTLAFENIFYLTAPFNALEQLKNYQSSVSAKFSIDLARDKSSANIRSESGVPLRRLW